MAIHEEDVARVRETTDIVALISEYVPLKRVGRRWQGLCPFHAEKTPSFSVNAEMGVYHCFGCKASGDAITFVREIENADFVDAVERLASRLGIALRYTSPNESINKQKRAKLAEALERAVQWYHQRLLTASDAAQARSYLRQRGYSSDMVRRYKLGWAPDDWDALAVELQVGADTGMPTQVFADAGLGFRNKSGRIQDSFRARVLFPIFDPSNKPLGFGGRVLPGGEGPKYKNSVDNAVYRKSRTLYGLNWAKQDIVNADEVIVCEGYTDVIGFHQAGISRAVATCGTAATDEHMQILQRYANRIVLAFDPDTAGGNAAERFLQWEGAVQVEVADLPEGADPGDLAQNDPQRLQKAIQTRIPFPRFRFTRAIDQMDTKTPTGRLQAAKRAAEIVAPIKDPAVRDLFLVEIATVCQQNEAGGLDRLRAIAANHRSPKARTRTSRSQDAPNNGAPHPADMANAYDPGNRSEVEADTLSRPPDNVERQVLWLAVNEPTAVWEEIVSDMFHYPLYWEAFEALLEYPDIDNVLRRADPKLSALIRELLVLEDEELRVSRHQQDIVMARLVYESAQRELTHLERLARTASADEDLLLRVPGLKLAADKLRESEWAPTEAHALLQLLQPEERQQQATA